MEDVENIKNPYKGFGISILFLIGIPTVVTVIFYYIIVVFYPSSGLSLKENMYMVHGLSFTIASLFDLILILSGLLRKGFIAVKYRLSEFFSGVFYYPRQACKIYKDNIKEYGITFWPYLLIILGTFAFAAYNIINFVKIYAYMFPK